LKHLFVTGLHRSGTTLLEKILLNHPQVFVASQPAPILYYEIKSIFLQSKGLKRQYPLDTLFGEREYTQEEWKAFLLSFQISKELLREVGLRMKTYEGQLMKQVVDQWDKIKEGKFLEVYQQILQLSFQLSSPKEILYSGSKEIMCEEYIPYFLDQGVKVFCIIRDPRDMILSTNSGKEMGLIRPTLFYLRNWRKSVAFALTYQAHPNFCFIKYEDLISNFSDHLNKITRFLDIEEYAKNFTELKDQSGKTWDSNSSFDSFQGISSGPIGRYKQGMNEETIRFIETFCYPEMKTLAYATDFVNQQSYNPDLLNGLQEPYPMERTDFPKDYSVNKFNLDLEKLRILYLTMKEPITVKDIPSYFITEQVFERLTRSILK